MKTYTIEAEESFFENKRFSDEHLPTYRDIAFLIGIDIYSEHWKPIADKPISLEMWNKLKPHLFFDSTKKIELPNLRRQVFAKNPMYSQLMNMGVIQGFETFPFRDTTLEKALQQVNLRGYSSLYEYFARGDNIGTCGNSSKLIGVMFDKALFHKGIIPSFIGTPKSENGIHAWMTGDFSNTRKIIDTSLLLVIPEQIGERLGYIPTHTYTLDQITDRSVHDFLSEEYYDHYFQASKESTQNKSSFQQFCQDRNLLKEMEDWEI